MFSPPDSPFPGLRIAYCILHIAGDANAATSTPMAYMAASAAPVPVPVEAAAAVQLADGVAASGPQPPATKVATLGDAAHMMGRQPVASPQQELAAPEMLRVAEQPLLIPAVEPQHAGTGAAGVLIAGVAPAHESRPPPQQQQQQRLQTQQREQDPRREVVDLDAAAEPAVTLAGSPEPQALEAAAAAQIGAAQQQPRTQSLAASAAGEAAAGRAAGEAAGAEPAAAPRPPPAPPAEQADAAGSAEIPESSTAGAAVRPRKRRWRGTWTRVGRQWVLV